MLVHQLVGWTLINTSAITAIVGASTEARVWFGTRPQTSSVSAMPCINYYELSNGQRNNGIGAKTFSINCRATTPGAATNLAEKVIDLFSGSSGTGIYGTNNGFDIARTSLRSIGGVIPEPDNLAFNAPVDVLIVYPVDTVS